MNKVELLKYLLSSNLNVSWIEIGIGLLASFLLSLLMYFVYKKTYSGVLYSKSFNSSLVIFAIITTVIIMVIGSNLALSLGMVGSLSIIRFRTAIKDTRDMMFLFWAICIGLSCGSGTYYLGIIGSVFITIVIFIFKKGTFNETTYLLVIRGDNNVDDNKINELLKTHLKKFNLKMKNVTDSTVEITYEIDMKNVEDAKLINDLKEIGKASFVSIVSYNGEVAG